MASYQRSLCFAGFPRAFQRYLEPIVKSQVNASRVVMYGLTRAIASYQQMLCFVVGFAGAVQRNVGADRQISSRWAPRYSAGSRSPGTI